MERSLDLLRFGWSPLFEAALSWSVIARPKQTPMHLPWARRCRDLPDDLLTEIRVLASAWGPCVPGMFEVGLGGTSPRFEDELAAFDRLDDRTVALEMSLALGGADCTLGGEIGTDLLDDEDYVRAVRADAAPDHDRAALLEAVLDDPGAVRERCTRVLERYWDEAFATEWERLLPRIEGEVTDGARALVTGGAPGLVRELLPEGRWDETSSSIVVRKDWEGECDVAARGGLLFVPTVYGWPRVLIELNRPWPLAIIFPLRDLRQPTVSPASDAEVVDGMRALGDATRLQIARLVTEDPRSTTELAALLSLSDSAISRHLKILEASGLVTSHRDGYFVLYSLVPERVDVLARAMRGTLGLTPASGGDVPALPVSIPRGTPSAMAR